MRSPATAIALLIENAASIVTTLPLVKIRCAVAIAAPLQLPPRNIGKKALDARL